MGMATSGDCPCPIRDGTSPSTVTASFLTRPLKGIFRPCRAAVYPARRTKRKGLTHLAENGHALLLEWALAQRGKPWTHWQSDAILWAAASGGYEALCVQ